MISAAAIAGIILRLAPALAATPSVADRYAEDIAQAANGDDEMVLALVATADEESRFRPRIERCEYRGAEADSGRALGLFQLQKYWLAMHTRKEVCGDNGLASRLAAKALGTLRQRHGGMHAAMRWYVGTKDAKDKRVARRIETFERLRRMAKGAA